MSEADELLAFILGKRARKVARLRRARRAARPRTPNEIEMAYERELVGISRRLSAEVQRFLDPLIEEARKAEAREDAGEREDANIFSRFLDLDFGLLRIRLLRIVTEQVLSPILDRFGRQIAKWNARDIARILLIDIADESPAVRAALERWRRENVSLITSIAERLLRDVFERVSRYAREGGRVETFAREIAERYKVSDSRARLIARDQVLKANSDLTRIRHEEAGVTRYIWSTSRDERVRGNPTGKWPDGLHYQLEGRVFSWAEPPVTNKKGDRNHPGQDYQCRCVAIPVLDD